MNMINNQYFINTDMMQPSTVNKAKAEYLASIKPSTVSMKSPELLQNKDGMAYLIKGGR